MAGTPHALGTGVARMDRRCQRMVGTGSDEGRNALCTSFARAPQQVFELAYLVATIHGARSVVVFHADVE